MERRHPNVTWATQSRVSNLLIMSNAQSAFTTNFPHAMDENARHMAYLLDTCRDRSIKQFEADLDASKLGFKRLSGSHI